MRNQKKCSAARGAPRIWGAKCKCTTRTCVNEGQGKEGVVLRPIRLNASFQSHSSLRSPRIIIVCSMRTLNIYAYAYNDYKFAANRSVFFNAIVRTRPWSRRRTRDGTRRGPFRRICRSFVGKVAGFVGRRFFFLRAFSKVRRRVRALSAKTVRLYVNAPVGHCWSNPRRLSELGLFYIRIFLSF